MRGVVSTFWGAGIVQKRRSEARCGVSEELVIALITFSITLAKTYLLFSALRCHGEPYNEIVVYAPLS